jgi:hypothetical protein
MRIGTLFIGLMAALLSAGSVASAQATPAPNTTQISTASDWRTPATSPGQVHPLWSFQACAGEFISVNVAAGGFVYGGEQSCTSSASQTLEFLLLNSNGDVVAAPEVSWVGNQNYIHRTNKCSNSTNTLWKEYAYGTANGVQLQPYPALKNFTLNCYTPGINGGCSQNQIRANLIKDGEIAVADAIRVRPDC